MQVKTSELSGVALNWAVNYALHGRQPLDYVEARDNYSTCWNKAGPIIEREGISWHCGNKANWHAYGYGSADNISGTTPLIAAMRCYVGSKLGDTIEIPDELTNG